MEIKLNVTQTVSLNVTQNVSNSLEECLEEQTPVFMGRPEPKFKEHTTLDDQVDIIM